VLGERSRGHYTSTTTYTINLPSKHRNIHVSSPCCCNKAMIDEVRRNARMLFPPCHVLQPPVFATARLLASYPLGSHPVLFLVGVVVSWHGCEAAAILRTMRVLYCTCTCFGTLPRSSLPVLQSNQTRPFARTQQQACCTYIHTYLPFVNRQTVQPHALFACRMVGHAVPGYHKGLGSGLPNQTAWAV
jgi:hypothetical protein